MIVELVRRRFTVEEYHRMGEAGILDEDDRLELIDGEIVEMSPIGQKHMGCVNRLTRLLVTGAGSRALVSVQNPVALGRHFEPQPDFVLFRPRADDYSHQAAGPADVLLVVEVADSSLDRDRRIKLPRYAQAGLPEVWIVNLEGEGIECHRDPQSGGYAQVTTHGRGATLAPSCLPDLVLRVDDVLPPV